MSKNLIKIPVQKVGESSDLPKYAYPGDAGFDLVSSEDIEIEPQQRTIVKCDFSMAIPDGFAGLVIPRSGLAAKHGISVVNSPGLIDSGYRGEICVILLNTDTSNTFKVSVGDRIAQMLIVPFAKAEFIEVDHLEETERSNKGFGSSGLKSKGKNTHGEK